MDSTRQELGADYIRVAQIADTSFALQIVGSAQPVRVVTTDSDAATPTEGTENYFLATVGDPVLTRKSIGSTRAVFVRSDSDTEKAFVTVASG